MTFLEVLHVLGGESDPDLVDLLLWFLQTRLGGFHRCVSHGIQASPLSLCIEIQFTQRLIADNTPNISEMGLGFTHSAVYYY